MDTAIDLLYYNFVEKEQLDAFPLETAEAKALFRNYPLAVRDEVDSLVCRAKMTAFREGLRLGLELAADYRCK